MPFPAIALGLIPGWYWYSVPKCLKAPHRLAAGLHVVEVRNDHHLLRQRPPGVGQLTRQRQCRVLLILGRGPTDPRHRHPHRAGRRVLPLPVRHHAATPEGSHPPLPRTTGRRMPSRRWRRPLVAAPGSVRGEPCQYLSDHRGLPGGQPSALAIRDHDHLDTNPRHVDRTEGGGRIVTVAPIGLSRPRS